VKDVCSWQSGISYEQIRLNREKRRDEQIRQLIANGGVFLKDYPAYIVFENGDVYSTLNRKVAKLKPGTKPAGYRFVRLSVTNRTEKYEMIHRLVAKTFIPNPMGYDEVNHIDGDKNNNHVSNLEWCTSKMNHMHARVSGLIKNNVSRLGLSCSELLQIFHSEGRYRDIGDEFGVSAQTVCNIKRGKGCYSWLLQK
jgi:hypothetical protein